MLDIDNYFGLKVAEETTGIILVKTCKHSPQRCITDLNMPHNQSLSTHNFQHTTAPFFQTFLAYNQWMLA